MLASPEINRSTLHTPRSHTRSDRSPFVEGKKNGDFISPTYTSNIFTNNNHSNNIVNTNTEAQNIRNSQNFIHVEKNEELTRAKLDKELSQHDRASEKSKKGPISQISVSSTSAYNDLVCNNCINKHLMQERQEREMTEKERNLLLKQINDSNNQLYMQKENEKRQFLKNQYAHDAKVQLEQINDRREREEQIKRSGNKLEYDFFNSKSSMMKTEERKNELKNCLLNQINQKEIQKKDDKKSEFYQTSIGFGDNYRSKSSNNLNYVKDLKDQIMMKEQQKQYERNSDLLLGQKQKEEQGRLDDEYQERKKRGECQKQTELKQAYQTHLQNKISKQHAEEQEKNYYYDRLNKLYEELNQQKYSDIMRKKALEKSVNETLRSQIEYRNLLKKQEENERRTPIQLCQHGSKSYACSECQRKYPKVMLCKRAESPLKYSNKKN